MGVANGVSFALGICLKTRTLHAVWCSRKQRNKNPTGLVL